MFTQQSIVGDERGQVYAQAHMTVRRGFALIKGCQENSLVGGEAEGSDYAALIAWSHVLMPMGVYHVCAANCARSSGG